MNAKTKTIPFFCAGCDRELSASTGAIRKPDGRTICGYCQRQLDQRKREQAQPDLFVEQKSLFNPKRRNVEGYTDATGFHPIRASKDYNEFLAGGFEPGRSQAAKRDREQREWEDKELREARESSGAPRKTLAQFVRSMGGIVPGGMFAGEIQRLGYHETGTTGLLNQHARQGTHKQTAEYVMDAANVEGYTDRHGERFTRIGDFLAAVEASAVKGIDHYRQRGATAKQRRTKQMAKATRNPKATFTDQAITVFSRLPHGAFFRFRNRKTVLTKLSDYGKAQDFSGKVYHVNKDQAVVQVTRKNPGMFGPEAKAAARQVQRIRPVKDRATGERGHIIGAGPQGWLKVQWTNRAKPTLIRRSELKLARGRQGNPTHYGLYNGRKLVTVYPNKKSASDAKIAHENADRQYGVKQKWTVKPLPPLTKKNASAETENQKAWRKGYEHGFKGMNSRPDYPLVGLAGSYRLGYEAGYKRRKEPKGPRKKPYAENPRMVKVKPERGKTGVNLRELKAAADTGEEWAKRAYKTALASVRRIRKAEKNPKAKGSRDALGVWHKENPGGHHLIRLEKAWKQARQTLRELKKEYPGQPEMYRDQVEYIKELEEALTARSSEWARFFAKAKPKKNNPSVTALSETFQGEADGSAEKSYAASSAPANLARAGKLVFLKVKTDRDDQGRARGNAWTFRVPGATVAIAPNEKLWIVGDHAPLFETKAKPGEGLDVGEVTHICYETAKAHIGGGKTYEYVHEFGEDGGKRPHLIIDHEGMPVLRGGDYKIKVEGIVN